MIQSFNNIKFSEIQIGDTLIISPPPGQTAESMGVDINTLSEISKIYVARFPNLNVIVNPIGLQHEIVLNRS